MFDRIAHRYDLLNHLLSFGADLHWRRRLVGLLDERPGLRIIDLAAGTGDLIIAALRRRPDIARAVGLDSSERMLELCREKVRRHDLEHRLSLVHANALDVPFDSESFDAVTIAFGIRNIPQVPEALAEMHRLLAPGGSGLILELSIPQNPAVRAVYLPYFRLLVPRLGRLVSGDPAAYTYLNTSVESFRSPAELRSLMHHAGFRNVDIHSLTLGVASILHGRKPR